MGTIPEKSVDLILTDLPKANCIDDAIVHQYTDTNWTLQRVADFFSTTRYKVRKILIRHGVALSAKGRRPPVPQERRDKLRKANLGRKHPNVGKTRTSLHNYRNMHAHLRFSVGLDWLLQFDDFEKLKCLNRAISPKTDKGVHRLGVLTDEFYIAYIERFWNCPQFNQVYTKWVKNNKNHYGKPSLDHIIPLSSGGDATLDNLQFLSWFENRCKNDMTQAEWTHMKNNLADYFVDHV